MDESPPRQRRQGVSPEAQGSRGEQQANSGALCSSTPVFDSVGVPIIFDGDGCTWSVGRLELFDCDGRLIG